MNTLKTIELMRSFLLFFFLLFLNLISFSQSNSCGNIGFENGTLDGWDGETGSCCPINTSPSGIINGRHTLMSGTGTDFYTNNVVKVVAPGSNFSARLGNDSTDAEAERMSYNLTVSPQNLLFIYKYAVVLQDPEHPSYEQPRFEVRVLDSNGSLIDPKCGEYKVTAAANIPGFSSNGDIRYKDWTTVGLDLTPYMGSTIKIEFSTGDCSQGGHFGYAYLDAACGPLEISTNYCTNATIADLVAPDGFEYLWSTGDTTQSISINNPIEDTKYTCLLTSVTGCQVELSTILKHLDPVADFELEIDCYYNAVFKDVSFVPNSVIIEKYLWNFGDGTTEIGLNPSHVYSAPGNYSVSLNISNSDGCVSTTSKIITVYNPPTATISYPSPFCETDNTKSVSLSGTGSYLGGVFSSSVGLSVDFNTGAINPVLSTPGTYIVNYEIPQFELCPLPLASTTVEIAPIPSVNIKYNSESFCKDLILEAPTLSGTGYFFGGNFTSSTGLSINSTSGNINPSLSEPGDYQVDYSTPLYGCEPQVFSTNVTIYPLPEFTIDDGAICVDELGNTIRDYQIQVPLNETDFNFNWFFNDNEISGLNSNTLIVNQAGNYSVKAINNETLCSSDLEFSIISTIQPFDFSLAFLHESSLGPTLEITPNRTGDFLFQLGNRDIQESNIFHDLDSGIYDVTVYDDWFCHQITKKAIVIDYPKFFTPNGDGYNDFWNLDEIDGFTGIKIFIFSRYGQLIKSFTTDQKGWDGTYNGKELPTTDYWFRVDYSAILDPINTAVWKEDYGHFSLKR